MIWLQKADGKPQPCLDGMVEHMKLHYGYRICPDQGAAEKAYRAAGARRGPYDAKSYWKKSRRG